MCADSAIHKWRRETPISLEESHEPKSDLCGRRSKPPNSLRELGGLLEELVNSSRELTNLPEELPNLLEELGDSGRELGNSSEETRATGDGVTQFLEAA